MFRTNGRDRTRTVRIAVVVAVALVTAACFPRDTSQIVLDDEQTFTDFGGSWELDYYVNPAYECGLSGHHSFMVMNPGGDPDAEAPLWVYLHGGGVGYWDEQGEYQSTKGQTEDTHNHQEDFDRLIWHLTVRTIGGNGQPEDQTIVRRVQEGYRVLVVSMCDHDLYAGVGKSYPNHPTNPDSKVDGHLATLAAIDYTAANYPTTHVWAHGTSAGSHGVWALAFSYGTEGTPLTGVVADSGVASPNLFDIYDAYLEQDLLRQEATWEPEGVQDKIGFLVANDFAYAENQIADRDFRAVPALWIVGDIDPFCAGNLPPVAEASALGLSNCGYVFSTVDQAIAGQANSPHELHLLPNTGHVPTNDPGPANDIVDDFIDTVLATNPPHFGSN